MPRRATVKAGGAYYAITDISPNGKVQTGIGAVTLRVPQVGDQGGWPETARRRVVHFTSSILPILPPYYAGLRV